MLMMIMLIMSFNPPFASFSEPTNDDDDDDDDDVRYSSNVAVLFTGGEDDGVQSESSRQEVQVQPRARGRRCCRGRENYTPNSTSTKEHVCSIRGQP
jgi:hypothetical protein